MGIVTQGVTRHTQSKGYEVMNDNEKFAVSFNNGRHAHVSIVANDEFKTEMAFFLDFVRSDYVVVHDQSPEGNYGTVVATIIAGTLRTACTVFGGNYSPLSQATFETIVNDMQANHPDGLLP